MVLSLIDKALHGAQWIVMEDKGDYVLIEYETARWVVKFTVYENYAKVVAENKISGRGYEFRYNRHDKNHLSSFGVIVQVVKYLIKQGYVYEGV